MLLASSSHGCLGAWLVLLLLTIRCLVVALRYDSLHVTEFLLERGQHLLWYLKLDGTWMVLHSEGILAQVLYEMLILQFISALAHLQHHVFIRPHLLLWQRGNWKYGLWAVHVLRWQHVFIWSCQFHQVSCLLWWSSLAWLGLAMICWFLIQIVHVSVIRHMLLEPRR